ncbi:MAG: hypothetical protein ABFS28_10900 [Bacteroidota bacterium]
MVGIDIFREHFKDSAISIIPWSEVHQDQFQTRDLGWFEPVREWVESAHQAGKLASSEDYSEIKQFIRKIGSNRCLLDRKVHFEVPPPFRLVAEYCRRRGIGAGSSGDGGDGKEKDTVLCMDDVLYCRGE